jgi:hypothetical protein
MARDIRLCCLARAGIEVASHDPPQNSTNGMSPRGHFLVSLSYLARSLDRIRTPHYVRLKFH